MNRDTMVNPTALERIGGRYRWPWLTLKSPSTIAMVNHPRRGIVSVIDLSIISSWRLLHQARNLPFACA